MDLRYVRRLQYTAFFEGEISKHKIDCCRENALKLIREGEIMTAALYAYSGQLFLYAEALNGEFDVNRIVSPLGNSLIPQPDRGKKKLWLIMSPVFWHAEPKNADEWREGRPRLRRRGRIAYLEDGKLSEYVFHHFALTQEGAFRGDKYMFISLYGNVLFSYFEEPRSSDNISGTDAESRAIGEWIKTDPDGHFIHLPGSEGQNFLILPALFDAGESDI